MKLKKILCGVMALALSATMLAGCGKKGGEGMSLEDGADVNTIEMQMEAGENGKITKEVFEPTLLLQNYDYEKMNVYKEAFNYTNVKPVGYIAPTADAVQQFDLMISDTQNKMADIVVATVANINKAGSEAFVPLDTLIDRFAPNIKAYFEAHPEVKAACVNADGNLYVIPTTYDTIVSEGFFIRQDWLDKLGLQVPTTVDEYYNVLKAFKTQDPNGNGKADEIPFFQRGKSYLPLAQLWGAYHREYIGDDNKVHNGRTEEEFKVAMQNIIKWRQEGLIDPEISTRSNAREELLGTNVGGSTHDWFSSTGSFQKTVKESHAGEAWAEDFNWVAILPPADVNGEIKDIYSRSLMRGQGWAISATNGYIVETIKYFDWWFTEQGKMAYWYGMEGVDYTIENGVPTFTSLVMDSKNGVPMYLRENGQLEQGAPMSMAAEMAGMVEDAKAGFMLYNTDAVEIKPQLPTLSYTKEEQDELTDLQTSVNTHIDETIAKWYVGDEPLNDDTWNAYIAEAKNRGLDRILEIKNAAYERLVARGGGVDKPAESTFAE